MVFNVVPTALEVTLVAGILAWKCGPALAGLTASTLVAYIAFTFVVTQVLSTPTLVQQHQHNCIMRMVLWTAWLDALQTSFLPSSPCFTSCPNAMDTPLHGEGTVMRHCCWRLLFTRAAHRASMQSCDGCSGAPSTGCR
jgi:hypothetical protein